MKNIFTGLWFLTLIFLLPFQSQAQFGRMIKDRVQKKVERKVEEKIVEEISEAIAREAFKPIEKSIDELFKSSYENETGDSVDWEKAGAAYSDFLLGMNKAANVPDAYTFDYSLEVEVKDYDDKKHNMRYFFSKDGKIMGMQEYSADKKDVVVFDSENDVMVVYSVDKNGKKTAQALPSVMKLASAFAGKAVKEEMEKQNFNVSKTGKTKKIIGYTCDEYLVETDEDKTVAYVSNSFPVSFTKTFGESMNNFLPSNYTNSSDLMEGMSLLTQYQNKEDKKRSSSFEAKKLSEEKTVYDNKDYGLKE